MAKKKLFTEYQKKTIYANGNGRCGICGRPMNFSEMTVDHITPISRGGTDNMSNLQPAHLWCNRIKNGLTMKELNDKISDILHYQRRKQIKSAWKGAE